MADHEGLAARVVVVHEHHRMVPVGFARKHLNIFLNTLFVQYYIVICRPSDHTVGRPPRAAIRTRRDGRSRLTSRLPLLRIKFCLASAFYKFIVIVHVHMYILVCTVKVRCKDEFCRVQFVR